MVSTENLSRCIWKRTARRFLWRATGTITPESSFRKTDGKYAIGQAVSASGDVLGPWVQEPETLNSDDGGHAMVFKDLKGRLMISYHAPNSQTEHPVITPIYIKDGKFVALN